MPIDLIKNKIYRGFDTTFPFDLSDALDDSIDLVGKTLLFTLKSDRVADDSTATLENDFVISSDNLDLDNAKLVYVSFTAAQMQAVNENIYYYDLKIFDDQGKGVIYVPYIEVQAIDDVTDRIAIS